MLPVDFQADSTAELREAEAAMRLSCIIQYSFCIRWSLVPEWDGQKMMLARNNLQTDKKTVLDHTWICSMVDINSNVNAMEEAAKLLPLPYHEYTFMACARIVVIKGFEEDIRRLSVLSTLLAIDDSHAEFMMNLAKHEARIIRIGQKYRHG